MLQTEAEQFRKSPDRKQQPQFIQDITQPSPMAASKPVPNMTYESYMRDIGTPQGINLRNPFEHHQFQLHQHLELIHAQYEHALDP